MESVMPIKFDSLHHFGETIDSFACDFTQTHMVFPSKVVISNDLYREINQLYLREHRNSMKLQKKHAPKSRYRSYVREVARVVTAVGRLDVEIDESNEIHCEIQ